jgi:hypothetical protein
VVLLGFCRGSAGGWLRFCWAPAVALLGPGWLSVGASAGVLLGLCWASVGVLLWVLLGFCWGSARGSAGGSAEVLLWFSRFCGGSAGVLL